MITTTSADFRIRPAQKQDARLILDLIKQLATYEKLAHTVVATEAIIEDKLFGKKPSAEVIIGEFKNKPVGFALFFHNYSTFTGKPGIYLEDLFIVPEHRNKGYGKIILSYLAKLAVERDCTRLEWSVLDWNEPSIQFYKNLGAVPMNEWISFRLSGDALSSLASAFQST